VLLVTGGVVAGESSVPAVSAPSRASSRTDPARLCRLTVPSGAVRATQADRSRLPRERSVAAPPRLTHLCR
jgi:hypothetical protein